MNTLYVFERTRWRDWLARHYATESDVWLVSYRKASDKPSLNYNDAVEEALCFGWIDSTRRGIDEECYAQRFSPRRQGSAYSQTNKERMARLIARGAVLEDVIERAGDIRPEVFEIPPDIRRALEAEPGAWAFFKSTAPSYQRIRAAYVDHARNRGAEFEKRLAKLVRECARKMQFGHHIETYY